MIVKILKFLEGKKNIIAGIITTTASYLVLKGVIGADLGTFISAISLLVFGSASIATGAMYKK